VQQILVIGYGNPLRGDDGFGGLAAGYVEKLRIPGLEVIVCHQLNPELAAVLYKSSYAIFLDAVAGDEPGTLNATPVARCDLSSAGMHHFEPGSLLALSQAIYGYAPPAMLITAATRSFDNGAEISKDVKQAAVKAAEAIALAVDAGNFDSQILSNVLLNCH
jgi:hydrogenase maturation protease